MKYHVVAKETFSVAGVRAVTEQPGGVWDIIKKDGRIQQMQRDAQGQPVTLGLCFGFDGTGRNDNMVGFVVAEEVPGYAFYAFPPSDWVVLKAEGKISDGVLYKTWQYIHGELIDRQVICQREVPTIEDYQVWNEESDYCRVEIGVAVV